LISLPAWERFRQSEIFIEVLANDKTYFKNHYVFFRADGTESFFPFLHISSVPGILLLALTLAITNTLLRPILVLIALPFNLITFGIASIFANLLTLIIANAICGTILFTRILVDVFGCRCYDVHG
jgi:hypothetical protein